ncbi:MAG: SpvB/TcaC N-terminal domain-containing protein [Pyrinomonadaceae bacterium]
MFKNQDYVNASSSESLSLKGQAAQTDASVSSTGSQQVPSISLPKGGGAIRGIGEKFAANPVTGTGSMTVPIATSPGRSSVSPQLTLSYDSGAGNGPFGFGWSLSLPSVTRKTDKGLPQYRDTAESDVFILWGAEDLVPVLQPDGSRFADVTTAPGLTIHRYRPRVEGLFARIERWTNQATGEIHWRSISHDNITTLYGQTPNARIADPADPRRAFTWLICESYDDKGNAIVYEYAEEDALDVDLGLVSERNRIRTANRYLKYIKYGNRVSRLVQPDLTRMDWMFEVVFDYEEDHYQELALDPNRAEAAQHQFVRASARPGRPWTTRPDPYSSHRAAFEVRAYRRCRRVLMFHHFRELGTEPCLVRSTQFEYADLDYSLPTTIEAELAFQGSTRFASFIRAVIQSGFVRDETRAPVALNGVTYVTYLKKSLPPLEFEYSKAIIQDDIRDLDADSLENLPIGLDGASYQWVDLDGEGVCGILTEQANAWFYKPNLGEAHFGPMETVASTPALAPSTGGRHEFLDLAGDGQLDLVAFADPTPGFYERTADEKWELFQTFRYLPNVPWDDPNLRFVDLSGDGHADILVTEDEVFIWHESLAEEGFGPEQRVRQPLDEENGPRLVFADGTQSIYLADMCGDGLSDLVRIRNGEVSYWPNQGYGRFGAKVPMDNSPWFDQPDQFNQRLIRLADIDGSGTNDIIYVGRDGVRLYFNQSGNRWSDPRRLRQFPRTDSLASVTTTDLLGNGTACLVWSSPLPGATRQPLRFIDLMGGQKPHLLIKSANNLGAETRVQYASSTKFYFADKLAGKPWITRVPFPVHVIERVETFDQISGNRFVTRYAYHHGYFDGVEREFRGFGMMEQRDTEEFAALNASHEFPVGTNIDESSHVPPVLTRTWFHTGVYLGRDHVSDFFAGLLDKTDVGEYYREPGLTDAQARQLLLEDTELPNGLSVEEEREACRALKGSMLRQEVYALDAPDEPQHPYTVTEQNFTIELVQGKGNNQHAVFLVHPREVISYHYERDPTDPRTTHALTLEVDKFGNVLKSAAIGYGRRQPDPNLPLADQRKQGELLITYTENDFTNHVDTADNYRTPLPSEARTYELTGLLQSPGSTRFTLSEFLTAGAAAVSIGYEQTPTITLLQKRLIEHVRTLYRRNDLTAPAPLGQLESLALPFENYKLAFTPGLISRVYGTRVANTMLADEGGYVHTEGDANWWIPSGQVFYSLGTGDNAAVELANAQAHFFLPLRYRDPFHTNLVSTEAFVTYDDYDLLTRETRDAVGNRVTVGERNVNPTQPLVRQGHDYRVLQPALMMEPNRNRSVVAFDALGMVVGTAVMGKPEDAPVPGDRLAATFRTDLTQTEIDQFVANPKGPLASTLLDNATSRIIYDLTCYWREPNPQHKPPTFAATLARETHASEPVPAGGLNIQVSFSYSDGFGREVEKKIQAEPGPVPKRDANGKIIVGADGQPQMTPNDLSPRWVGSGWSVFNNKGKPVRQYEPFYTDTHRFEFDVRIGVSPVLFYDPIERVVATLHPNHTWEKVVFDPWRQESWDASDTVLVADPKNDADVRDFFRRLPNAEYLPTWHVQRSGGALGPNEQDAADKTAIHTGTPSVSYFDSLGRTFLTVAHNRFKYSDTPLAAPPTEEFYPTRLVLDIEGNQHEVIDARVRVVMRYDYDLLGNRIHEASMEAGERWMLNAVTGKPSRSWNSRGYAFHTEYDALRRPVRSLIEGGDALDSNSEFFTQAVAFERTIYGESPATGLSEQQQRQANLRGKVFQQRDGAGIVTTDLYDFKGNLLRTTRRLAVDHQNTLDWLQNQVLEPNTFTSSTTYDALNRPTEVTAPDASVIRHIYNEANLLERVEVNLQGALQNGQPIWTPFVNDIDYNARGQRTLIEYGSGATATRSGVTTNYSYDPLTYRLVHLLTQRDAATFPDDCRQPPPSGWPGCQVQNLHYTYDPAGNITNIRDDAQQTIFFRNKRVEPSADYTYDAIYRLIEATGREHLGQVGGAPSPHSYNDQPRVGILLSTSDGNALGRYVERYIYDQVGNFKQVIHQGRDPVQPGWTRNYVYNESSLLEPGLLGPKSNRLTSTTIGATTETYSTAGNGYDAHGNMRRMPQLQVMRWDFKDQLHMTRRQAVNPSNEEREHDGERTWYVYDSGGQRVRKVTELAGGQIKDERIYLGGFEIYHQNGVNPIVRETLHVMDDKQRIALVETRTQGNDGSPPQFIRYQFGNHLGSASLELNDQAQLVSYEEYTPYGSTSYQAVRSQTETPKRYRYTGKEQDEESGLYYHGARYYAPWLGRWTSADPLFRTDKRQSRQKEEHAPFQRKSINETGLQNFDGRFMDSLAADSIRLDSRPISVMREWTSVPQVFNLYLYCANRPITYADPTGLKEKESEHSEISETAVKVITTIVEAPLEYAEHYAHHAGYAVGALKVTARVAGAIGVGVETAVAYHNEGGKAAAQEFGISGGALVVGIAVGGPLGIVTAAGIKFLGKPTAEFLERSVGLPPRDEQQEEFAKNYPITTFNREKEARLEKFIRVTTAMHGEFLSVLGEHVRSLNAELTELRSQGFQVTPQDLSEARQFRVERQLEAVRDKYNRILQTSQ